MEENPRTDEVQDNKNGPVPDPVGADQKKDEPTDEAQGPVCCRSLFEFIWEHEKISGVPGRAGSCVRVFRIVGWVAVVCTLFALLAHYGINYSLTRDSYDGFSEILRLEPGQEHFFPPVTICANGPGLKVNLTKCVATGCVYPADYDICSYEITNVTSICPRTFPNETEWMCLTFNANRRIGALTSASLFDVFVQFDHPIQGALNPFWGGFGILKNTEPTENPLFECDPFVVAAGQVTRLEVNEIRARIVSGWLFQRNDAIWTQYDRNIGTAPLFNASELSLIRIKYSNSIIELRIYEKQESILDHVFSPLGGLMTAVTTCVGLVITIVFSLVDKCYTNKCVTKCPWFCCNKCRGALKGVALEKFHQDELLFECFKPEADQNGAASVAGSSPSEKGKLLNGEENQIYQTFQKG